MAGYVYVLENKWYKDGLLKIGQTENNPEKRATELSVDTGVPFPFNVKAKFPTKHYKELEKYLHEKLDEKRVNPSREFFETDLKTIENLVEKFKIENYKIKPKNPKKILEKPLVRLFPHSREKTMFPTKQKIMDFFLKRALGENTYYLNKNVAELDKGTIIWIKYENEIIGEFTLERGIKSVERDSFNKQVLFDPKSLKFYSYPISYSDFIEFENTKKNHQAVHKVSYEVYYNLTKHLYEEESFIQARVNRNKDFYVISFENEVLFFNPNNFSKKIESIFSENLDLFEQYKDEICFSIYEEQNNLYWDFSMYNIEDNDDYEKLKNIIVNFSNIKKSVLSDFELFNIEEEQEFRIIEEQLICDTSNLSIDEIVVKIDMVLEQILELAEKI